MRVRPRSRRRSATASAWRPARPASGAASPPKRPFHPGKAHRGPALRQGLRSWTQTSCPCGPAGASRETSCLPTQRRPTNSTSSSVRRGAPRRWCPAALPKELLLEEGHLEEPWWRNGQTPPPLLWSPTMRSTRNSSVPGCLEGPLLPAGPLQDVEDLPGEPEDHAPEAVDLPLPGVGGVGVVEQERDVAGVHDNFHGGPRTPVRTASRGRHGHRAWDGRRRRRRRQRRYEPVEVRVVVLQPLAVQAQAHLVPGGPAQISAPGVRPSTR